MRISDWSSDVCSSDLDHAKTAGADLADLERALGDAAVVEAEDAVDPAESVGGEQAARRKIAPRFPVARDAHRQQYRIIAKAREPVRRPADTGAIFCRELAVEPVRHAGEPRPAHPSTRSDKRPAGNE